jgi:hypothetical protein
MQTRFGFISLFSLLVILSGCAATPTYNHLAAEARPLLNEVDVYLVVPQDEIYAQIDQSNVAAAGGGGLLLALIDVAVESSRTKSAEELIQPVRDKLLDYDYAQVLATEVNSTLKSIEWLHAKDVVLLRSAADAQLNDLYGKSSASAVLYMTADYNLTSNFQSAVTSISLALYPKAETLTGFKERKEKKTGFKDLMDNIYRNNFTHATILVNDPKVKKDDAAATVAGSSPALLIGALSDNAKNLGMKIKDDIVIAKTANDK